MENSGGCAMAISGGCPSANSGGCSSANSGGCPLANSCDSIWAWSETDRSEQCILFGPSNEIALFHPNWSFGSAAVRGAVPLNGGRHFWEIFVTERIFGTSVMFGVGTDLARLSAVPYLNLLGENENSWGLSHKGYIWHGGKCSEFTTPFAENTPTRIGILFDGRKGTLEYYKDGRYLGVAFKGLDSIKVPIYCRN
jgi:SPRY domain-containing SOCS box protein 3